MYLFNLSDEPVRPATQEEADASYAVPGGIITVEGVRYYVDEHDEDEDDSWQDEWRREIAMEAGMLGGCDAYNEVMGY
tara:strand:+ start:528 stop:761 length:234 start_codon:yes stop_codon:yes gene_type:complete